MRTTFRHLTEAGHDYDHAKLVLRELRAGARAEVVLDSAMPMQPDSTFTVSAEGHIVAETLLMDDEVALAFTLVDVSTMMWVSEGRSRDKITAKNVSRRPERFVAWFAGRRLGP